MSKLTRFGNAVYTQAQAERNFLFALSEVLVILLQIAGSSFFYFRKPNHSLRFWVKELNEARANLLRQEVTQ